MAIVIPKNLAPDTLPRIRGRFLVKPWRGIFVAAAWPKKRGKPKHPNTIWNSKQFGYAGRMAANSEPMQFETARFLTEGSHWLPRDLLTMAAYGKAYEVYLPDGTLCTQAPHGPPAIIVPEVWDVIAAAALVSNDGGWGGYTLRQRINAANITFNAGASTRITFASSPSVGAMNIAAAYVGVGAASGDTYDFASAPVPLLFGGASSIAVPQGTEVTSDAAAFSPVPGSNLVVSMYFSSPSSLKSTSAATGWANFYKFGNDASTVNASGYSVWTAASAVRQIEVLAP